MYEVVKLCEEIYPVHNTERLVDHTFTKGGRDLTVIIVFLNGFGV